MPTNLIESFCQVTGADEQTALSFLNACNENLDAAVSLFLDDPNSVSSAYEQYRRPIPQRTEQLVPVEIPTFPLRSRRRAFVTEDSDEEDSSAAAAAFRGQRISNTSSATTLSGYVSNSSLSAHSGSSTSLHTSGTSTATLSTCPDQNGSRESKAKKSDHLRQLYQPPTELLFKGTLASAQTEALERKRWLLISLHDEGCFDCHLLNRDVWKDPRIYQIVKRNFVFLQIPVDSPEGLSYQSRHSYVNSASHIAILDPITNEQKVMWINLKDPQSVHDVLTEFLKRSRIPGDVQSSAFDIRQSTRGTPTARSCVTSTYPAKRARVEDRVNFTAGLSSRVAAVSSQISEEPYSQFTTLSSSNSHLTVTGSVVPTEVLDLTEEEQLQLAVEASKTDADIFDSATTAACSGVPRSKSIQSDSDGTDDVEENGVTILSDDDGSPDCFICDPDTEFGSGLSTTALITSRRPLRCDITTRIPSPITPTNRFTLPIANSTEDAVELVVRLPTGSRQILRLSPTLTLQNLRRHFESCGFPDRQYEIVRLYPHINLSALPGHTTLRDTGLAKKDTIFLQDRC